MPKTFKRTATADEIAEMATRGEDVSASFTNKFQVVRPVHRVNVDLTLGMLRELDERAARLNVSRQAVIKALLRQVLGEGRGRAGSKGAAALAQRGKHQTAVLRQIPARRTSARMPTWPTGGPLHR